ncbi:MAG: hypothetical protein MK083_01145 [Dehalococcoidia bacterium]|nr:hypothetical protein [Dehalococcoidia bacterium]
MSSKDFNEIINNSNGDIGFNFSKSKTNNDLLVIGLTNSDIKESDFICNAYLYSNKPKNSKQCVGKIINSKDTLKSLDDTDFVLIEDPKNVNFNIFNYEKSIGMIINKKITDERKDTIENFEFDFLIYDQDIESFNNLEDMLIAKDMINSIRSNWFIKLKSNILDDINFQFLYHIGFSGIVLDLSEMTINNFSNISSKLSNLEVKKSGKF